MKIWIVSMFDNLPMEGFRRQRYWQMSAAFVRAGHEVVYWTTDFNHGTKAKRKLTGVSEKGITVRMIPVREYQDNVSFRRILSHRDFAYGFWRKALEEPEHPDLIISATPALGGAIMALKLSKRLGAKFGIDIQDAWPETFYRLLPSGLKWLGRLVFAPMKNAAGRLYREADFVTGVSARYQKMTKRRDYRLFYHGF